MTLYDKTGFEVKPPENLAAVKSVVVSASYLLVKLVEVAVTVLNSPPILANHHFDDVHLDRQVQRCQLWK